MTRRMVVTSEDGSRYDAELEEGDRLEITRKGHLRFVQDGYEDDPRTIRLVSPAVSVAELVEEPTA